MSDEPDDDDTPTDWDSGPFCRHWSDPWDCACLCVCGHTCGQHERDAPGGCDVDGCPCEAWREADDEAPEDRP